MDQYLDYAQGYNLTNRMPLWVKPNQKINVTELMDFMGDHYENTWFQFDQDVGAEAFNTPYRWRPLTWQVGTNTYVNERSAGVQQTGFSMVAQMRSWLPSPVGGLMWFGVDDADSVVHTPIYSASTSTPKPYTCTNPDNSVPNGDLLTFDFNSAFWVFNLVTNYAYPRYNTIHPEVRQKILQYRSFYTAEIPAIDQTAMNMYKSNPTQALDFVTSFSVTTAEALVADWQGFFGYLFTKYMDGNIKTPSPTSLNPNCQQPGYSATWYQRIVNDTGDHYEQPTSITLTASDYRKLRFL
jgi:dipeptidase